MSDIYDALVTKPQALFGATGTIPYAVPPTGNAGLFVKDPIVRRLATSPPLAAGSAPPPVFDRVTHTYDWQPAPDPNDYYGSVPAYSVPDTRQQSRAGLIAGLAGLLLGGMAGATAAMGGMRQGYDQLNNQRQTDWQRQYQQAGQQYDLARQSASDHNADTMRQMELDAWNEANLVRQQRRT